MGIPLVGLPHHEVIRDFCDAHGLVTQAMWAKFEVSDTIASGIKILSEIREVAELHEDWPDSAATWVACDALISEKRAHAQA